MFSQLNVFTNLCRLGALAGGVDEELFIKSFEDVPKVQFFSVKELEDHLLLIKNTIQDPNNDWSKRSEAVSRTAIVKCTHSRSYPAFQIAA